MRHPRKLFRFYWLPVFCWMGLIFFLSTSAGGSGNTLVLLRKLISWLEPGHTRHLTEGDWDPLNYVVRKMAHVTEYTILTLLTIRAFQFGASKLMARSLGGAFVLALAYACSDEFHQSFIPGRTAVPRDVFIDSIGITLTLIAVTAHFALKAYETALLKTAD